MLTYEQRLERIKSKEDLKNQIRLAGEAIKRQQRLVKKVPTLAEKLEEKRKIRLFEKIRFDLMLNQYKILDALEIN